MDPSTHTSAWDAAYRSDPPAMCAQIMLIMHAPRVESIAVSRPVLSLGAAEAVALVLVSPMLEVYLGSRTAANDGASGA